jgi:hypothetical protein
VFATATSLAGCLSLLLRKNGMETTVNEHTIRKLDMAINRVDFSFIDFTERRLLVVIASKGHFV